MRTLGGGLLVLLGAGLFWAEARAQQFGGTADAQQFSTLLTGASARDVPPVPAPGLARSTTLDTSRAIRPPNANSAFRRPSPQPAFGLGRVFPKISLGSWPPKLPNLPVFGNKTPTSTTVVTGVSGSGLLQR